MDSHSNNPKSQIHNRKWVGIVALIHLIRPPPGAALVVLHDALISAHTKSIVDFTVNSRLPAMHGATEVVDAGGLMSYAANDPDLFRRSAEYVDRILKGAKPADLPIEQPTKFELIINLKAAKRIGLTIPANVLAKLTGLSVDWRI